MIVLRAINVVLAVFGLLSCDAQIFPRRPTMLPSPRPSFQPTVAPSMQPSGQPSSEPSMQPTVEPSMLPSGHPTMQPSSRPSGQPTIQPSSRPSGQPTMQPTGQPTVAPSMQPSSQPSSQPTSDFFFYSWKGFLVIGLGSGVLISIVAIYIYKYRLRSLQEHDCKANVFSGLSSSLDEKLLVSVESRSRSNSEVSTMSKSNRKGSSRASYSSPRPSSGRRASNVSPMVTPESPERVDDEGPRSTFADIFNGEELPYIPPTVQPISTTALSSSTILTGADDNELKVDDESETANTKPSSSKSGAKKGKRGTVKSLRHSISAKSARDDSEFDEENGERRSSLWDMSDF